MNYKQIHALAEAALDAAALHIQDHMNIKDGDVAGMFFAGDKRDELIQTLVDYIRTEQRFRNPPPWPFPRKLPDPPNLPPSPY